MNYKYIERQQEVDSLLPILMAKERWGIDSETTGFDPHKDKVVLLQIGNAESQYVIDTRKVIVEPLRPFFENPAIRKIGHHLKFDYKMIKGNFGIEIEGVRDTFLAEKLLHMGRKFSGYGLDDILDAYLGIKMDKTERDTFGKNFDIHSDFTEKQLIYAAKDVEFLEPVLEKQIAEMTKDGLISTWILESAALACFGDMEFAGLCLNKEKWKGIIEKNIEDAVEIKKGMNEIASQFLPSDMFGEIDINYNSPAQVVRLLQMMNIKVSTRQKDGKWADAIITSTNDKTMKKIKDCHFTKLLKKYRGKMVRINTFGQAFLNAIHPLTGRIHPEFDQLGTETGRISNATRSPVNMLNIPREAEMRNCFVGETDEVVETDDYSTCEIRIWAELSKDPELMAAFRNNIDVHCHVASKLYGKEVTRKDPLRTPAKSLNFGIAYGMGPWSLYERLNGDGFPITFDEAKLLFRKYEDEFKTGVNFLRHWGKRVLKGYELDSDNREIPPGKFGYLINKNGRRRYWHIPDHTNEEKYKMGRDDPSYIALCSAIEREGGNFLIQSVNADITKRAMVLIRRHKKENKVRTEFMNQVYDEIVTRTHKDDTESFHPIKLKLMKQAAEEFITSVPMEVDGHVGPFWTKD